MGVLGGVRDFGGGSKNPKKSLNGTLLDFRHPPPNVVHFLHINGKLRLLDPVRRNLGKGGCGAKRGFQKMSPSV
jgi:hypothetical protein